MMFGVIVFVAMLHLIFGYVLAVYLGYASFGSREPVSSTASFLALGEGEIVIADDLEGPANTDHGLQDDEPEPPAADQELQDGGLIKSEDSQERGEFTHSPNGTSSTGSSLAIPSPAILDLSASAAMEMAFVDQHDLAEQEHLQTSGAPALTEEIVRWLGLLTDYRQEITRAANLLWCAEAEDLQVLGNDVDISGSLASISRKIDVDAPVMDSVGASRERTEQGLVAREHFSKCLSETMHRLGAIDSSDQATYRESLQLAILEVSHAVYRFEESLTELQLGIWQDAGGLGSMHPDLLFDMQSGLPTSLGIVQEFRDFVKADDEDGQSAVLAMFDLDHSHRLNKEMGPAFSDELIAHVAKIARQNIPEGWILGRYSGQRFLVLIPNQKANTAAEDVERLRETIAALSFLSGHGEHRLTITCAVIDTSPDESLEVIFGRLWETFSEAKNYGRNRTFLHEGTYPAPVIPATLDIEKQVIDLNF